MDINEGDERTNEFGLFNYADSYLLCGKQLIEDRDIPESGRRPSNVA
jgi:hypothetical protein